jgi:hypothetical protein
MQDTTGSLVNSYNNSILQNNKKHMDPDDYDQRANSEYVAPYTKYSKNVKQAQQQAQPANAQPLAPNEVKRITKDGRTAIFDATTKKFLRYE